MCDGIPVFSNNKKAFHGVGTNSHSTAAEMLKIKEDEYMKSEYHWWDKTFVPDHYDSEGEKILKEHGVDITKATKVAEKYSQKFTKQTELVRWLKKTPSEWGKLIEPKYRHLAKKVHPKLLIYQDKIKKFKKENIEKYNPYQATKLPRLKDIKKKIPQSVRESFGESFRESVRESVRESFGESVGESFGESFGESVGESFRESFRESVGESVWQSVWQSVRESVGESVWQSVRESVGESVWQSVRQSFRDQIYSVSYWAIKVSFGLPIKHWFFDFLKLGVMIVFIKGKVKVFGKKSMYLGEYDQKDFES